MKKKSEKPFHPMDSRKKFQKLTEVANYSAAIGDLILFGRLNFETSNPILYFLNSCRLVIFHFYSGPTTLKLIYKVVFVMIYYGELSQ